MYISIYLHVYIHGSMKLMSPPAGGGTLLAGRLLLLARRLLACSRARTSGHCIIRPRHVHGDDGVWRPTSMAYVPVDPSGSGSSRRAGRRALTAPPLSHRERLAARASPAQRARSQLKRAVVLLALRPRHRKHKKEARSENRESST